MARRKGATPKNQPENTGDQFEKSASELATILGGAELHFKGKVFHIMDSKSWAAKDNMKPAYKALHLPETNAGDIIGASVQGHIMTLIAAGKTEGEFRDCIELINATIDGTIVKGKSKVTKALEVALGNNGPIELK